MEGYSKAGQGHEEIQEEIEREFQDLARFLEAQFGIVKLDDKDHNLTVNVDGSTAVVDGVKFVSVVFWILMSYEQNINGHIIFC